MVRKGRQVQGCTALEGFLQTGNGADGSGLWAYLSFPAEEVGELGLEGNEQAGFWPACRREGGTLGKTINRAGGAP